MLFFSDGVIDHKAVLARVTLIRKAVVLLELHYYTFFLLFCKRNNERVGW